MFRGIDTPLVHDLLRSKSAGRAAALHQDMTRGTKIMPYITNMTHRSWNDVYRFVITLHKGEQWRFRKFSCSITSLSDQETCTALI